MNGAVHRTAPSLPVLVDGGAAARRLQVVREALDGAFHLRIGDDLDAFGHGGTDRLVALAVMDPDRSRPWALREAWEELAATPSTGLAPRWIVVGAEAPVTAGDPSTVDSLAPWEVPGHLLPRVTLALGEQMLEGCRIRVARTPALSGRLMFRGALLLALDTDTPPPPSVQSLARASGLSRRTLQDGWITLKAPGGYTLKRFLMAILLLRALLRHLQQPELSWSLLAPRMGVTARTLRRHAQTFLDARLSELAATDLPALVLQLGTRLQALFP